MRASGIPSHGESVFIASEKFPSAHKKLVEAAKLVLERNPLMAQSLDELVRLREALRACEEAEKGTNG